MSSDYESLEEHGPLVVMSHGKEAAVVVSPSMYDELVERLDQLETLLAVREGLQQIEDGESMDLDQGMEWLRRRAADRKA
ncbi:MAG: type II toxin-antitoxin system Phd/YefM family antitoxin [Myxococcales bacterium]|nr:type II toxin-antitoxin system Phd/YefM family antitoxin [Myxococcales bacterium]